MTAKERFERIDMLNAMIRVKMAYVARLRDALTISSPPTDAEYISRTRNVGSLADRIAMVVDAEREIDEMIDEMVDLKKQVEAALMLLDKPKHVSIMAAHFIEGKKPEEIAEEQHYTRRWVEKIIAESLAKMDEMLSS